MAQCGEAPAITERITALPGSGYLIQVAGYQKIEEFFAAETQKEGAENRVEFLFFSAILRESSRVSAVKFFIVFVTVNFGQLL